MIGKNSFLQYKDELLNNNLVRFMNLIKSLQKKYARACAKIYYRKTM